MSQLYRAVAGSVVRTQVDSPSFVSIDGLDLQGGKMMTSSVRIDRGQDFQILKTLSQAIYVYAFGETPGRVQVGGIVFLADCGSRAVSGRSIQMINSYYEESNIYSRKDAVRVAADGAAFVCYLTNLSIVLDQNQFNYGSFSLGFTLIPEN